MTLQPRDRRALAILGASAVVAALFLGLSGGDEKPAVVAIDNIPAAERRLERLRRLAASVPGKDQVLRQVQSELGRREAGLIQADTAAQAQAQLVQIVRRLARAENLDVRNTEIGEARKFGADYGEVSVSANFECGIEQLLNLMAALTAQKETIGTTDLRVGAANPKQKTMPVRLTVSGLVRKELVAERGARSSL